MISDRALTNPGNTNLNPANTNLNLSLEMPPREKGASHCRRDDTVMSDSARDYRHFAVDTENGDIVYFSDRNPHRPGMHCYTTLDSRRWNGRCWEFLKFTVYSLLT